jgi:hypothetical protein
MKRVALVACCGIVGTVFGVVKRQDFDGFTPWCQWIADRRIP